MAAAGLSKAEGRHFRQISALAIKQKLKVLIFVRYNNGRKVFLYETLKFALKFGRHLFSSMLLKN